MTKNIFLIGPASVGKSTTAELLATHLGFNFVDIDLAFCDRIALVSDYINTNTYTQYCERNSQLVDELVLENPHSTVFATPSGFLVHEGLPHLVRKHLDIIRNDAISILLLPSRDPHHTADLIAQRQKDRWPEMDLQSQKERYIQRHGKYIKYGDIKIIGKYSPKETVRLAIKKLES